MSWSIEEHIGECRPFPAQVVVYKGETDEYLAYVSGEVADRLKAENAKLRKLVRRLINHVEHPPCEGCGFEMNCDGEHVTQCDEWLFMVADARELGVTE